MRAFSVMRVSCALALLVSATAIRPAGSSPTAETGQPAKATTDDTRSPASQQAGPQQECSTCGDGVRPESKMPLDLHLKSAAFGEALIALGEAAGVSVLVEFGPTPLPRRDVNIAGEPLESALNSLARTYRLELWARFRGGFVLVWEKSLDAQDAIRRHGTVTPFISGQLSVLQEDQIRALALRLPEYPELDMLAKAEARLALRLWSSLSEEQRSLAGSTGIPLAKLSPRQQTVCANLMKATRPSDSAAKLDGLSLWLSPRQTRNASRPPREGSGPDSGPVLLCLRIAAEPANPDAMEVTLPVRVAPTPSAPAGERTASGPPQAVGNSTVSVQVLERSTDPFRMRLQIVTASASLPDIVAAISKACSVSLAVDSDVNPSRQFVIWAPDVTTRGIMSGLALAGGVWKQDGGRLSWRLCAEKTASAAQVPAPDTGESAWVPESERRLRQLFDGAAADLWDTLSDEERTGVCSGRSLKKAFQELSLQVRTSVAQAVLLNWTYHYGASHIESDAVVERGTGEVRVDPLMVSPGHAQMTLSAEISVSGASGKAGKPVVVAGDHLVQWCPLPPRGTEARSPSARREIDR